MFVRTSMGSESQGATKIMSGFTDPRVYSSMKIMTLDMYMNAMNQVLCVSPSFLPCVMTKSTSRLTGVYMTNNSCQESVLEDTHCKEEEQYDSEFEDDEWPFSVGFIKPLFHCASIVGIYGRIGLSKYISNLSVCYLHCPVEREIATQHVYGDQENRFWFDEWCFSPPFHKRHALPH